MGATILATLNELIQKLDDLDTQDELTILGDKIDDLATRIAPSGQNIQQTLHTGMMGPSGAYLGGLSNLSVLSAIRQQMQKCCEDFSSQDVPNSQLPPTKLTQKCINANYIFDTTLNLVNRLHDAHADGTLSTILSGGVVYASIQLMGILVDGPLPFGDAIGFFTGIAAALISMNVNFSDIVTDLTTNKNTIICDLLNSRSQEDVTGAFEDNMPTCSTIEKGFFKLILVADLVNILYNDGYEIPESYTPGYDCGGCNEGGCDCGDYGVVALVDGLTLDAIYKTGTDQFEINAAFNNYYTFDFEVTTGVAYLNGYMDDCACGGLVASCCTSVMFYGSDAFSVTFSNVQVTTSEDCICY
jgi:hypothetical protein